MNKKVKTLFLLHLLLAVYSLSGLCSKLAAGEEFLSLGFCMYYGAVLLLLAIYALCWQQIIKRMPLSAAYANRAVTVLWGIVWGILFFGEQITIGKVFGAVLVIIGVVSYCLLSKGEMDG